jgi:hypothetical protein
MVGDKTDYFQANSRILKKYHYHVWEKTVHSGQPPRGKLIFTDGRLPNLQVEQNGAFHFMHDMAEIEGQPDVLNTISELNPSVVVLLGCGLGYCPRAILKKRPVVQNLILFELDPGIFIQALHASDLSCFLSDPRLILCIGESSDLEEILGRAQKSLQLEDIHTLKHHPSIRLNPEVYTAWAKDVFKVINRFSLDGGTILKHGQDFMKNRLTALTSIHRNRLLESLKGRFKDIPAIIVAAGPSLDRSVQELKEIHGKAVLICADAALPALLSYGVTPDFVTCIDFLELTYEKIAHVARRVDRDLSLICLTTATYKVPKLFPAKEVFWAFSANHINNWVNKMVGGSYLTPPASTVAHLNFIAAKMFECSPIIFVGQDLAYTDKKNYAQNITLSEGDEVSRNIATGSVDIVWVDGYNGEKLPSSRNFYAHIQAFERMIEALSDDGCEYINTSEGGAMIKGTRPMALKEAVERYLDGRIEIEKIISAATEVSNLPDSSGLKATLEKMIRDINELNEKISTVDQLGKIVKTQLISLTRNKKKINQGDDLPDGLRKKLHQLDTLHTRIDKDEVWPLLDEITLEKMRDSERMMVEISCLKQQPGKFLDWLLKSMDRLTFINQARLDALGFFNDFLTYAVAHRKEETLLLASLEGNDDPATLERLATLYMDSEDMLLAEPYIERLSRLNARSALTHYFKGMMSVYRCEYRSAGEYFKTAEELDPGYREKIADFRFEQGNLYQGFVEWYRPKSKVTLRKMMVKGLCICPEHGGLRLEFENTLDSDIDAVEKNLEQAENLLIWIQYIETEPGLALLAGASRVSKIFRLYSAFLAGRKNLDGARQILLKGMDLVPDDPEIYLLLTDVLFGLDELEEGLLTLGQAVKMDQRYAGYYVNIGDNLLARGNPEAAVTAYRLYIAVEPGNERVLGKLEEARRKIGESGNGLQ